MNYDNLTKKEFAALKDGDLFDAAIYWTDKFSPFADVELFNKAPEPVQYFIVFIMLDGQVLNGGFNQFYYNGYNEYGLDYAAVLEAMGAKELAKIVIEANKIYEEVKHTLPTRDSGLEAFSQSYENDPFEEVTEKYAELQEKTTELITKYIRKNIDVFGE